MGTITTTSKNSIYRKQFGLTVFEDDGNEFYKHPDPLGFIDSNYQRFQIHITAIRKNTKAPYQYDIIGKTKVKDIVCSFKGTIVIEYAKVSDSTMGYLGFPNLREGVLKSKIQITEDPNQSAAGTINGKMETDIACNEKGELQYNAILLIADGYYNNQFVGQWTSYKTGKSKKCNWGDGRIPDSGDFGQGDGQFMPNDKYVKNGWASYVDYNSGVATPEKYKEALRIETAEWWR